MATGSLASPPEALAPDGACAAERAVVFACGSERLVGILHPAPGSTGLIIVVGGPQYRAGSHRHFVDVARGVASAGHAVLRFDARGMGDSTGAFPGFEGLTPDIGAAVDTLCREQPAVRNVVLWGLCDAASAVLLYAGESGDRRIGSMFILNPWVRSPEGLARTHLRHYYHERVLQRAFWLKLAGGGIGWRALRDLGTNLAQALRRRRAEPAGSGAASVGTSSMPFQDRMAIAWHDFPGEVHLMLSENDLTAQEFVALSRSDAKWQRLASRAQDTRQSLHGADHTFSSSAARQEVVAATITVMGRPALSRGSRALLPVILAGSLLLLGTTVPGPARAQTAPAPHPCGPIEQEPGKYGPFDYRTNRAKIELVERFHFTPKVEALIPGGGSSYLGDDLSYLMRTTPNHHRGLMAIVRYSEQTKSLQPPRMQYPTECYFDRAIRFQPDDTVVRVLYARYLMRLGERERAQAQLGVVTSLAGENALTHFNVGLAQLELGNHALALQAAHRARELGLDRPELEEKLKAAGHWQEPAR